MSIIRKITILVFLWLTADVSVAQKPQIITQDHPLYQLESRLMKGDKSALFEIAPYFDSKNRVIELLGYHRIETVESIIAKRVVSENCLFTDEEFRITDSVTTKQFSEFLNQNRDKIIFSRLATAFLITPLEKRQINFEVRAITGSRKQELKDSSKALLSFEWVKDNKIDSLIKQRSPISLLLIASELFKIRSRFNRYHFYAEDFTNLLQYLTGSEIGVENRKKEIFWHIDKDYYAESKLNLLIYFSKFYSHYVWNEDQAVFVNPDLAIKPIGKEEMLFQLLNNKNDSIAIEAFTQLTVCKPTKVWELADEYQNAGIHKSYAIPIFPYRFLKQLVLLTEYCKANNIDFTGTKELQNNITLLKTELSFTERRKLEDKLINTLTLDDITPLEYWALIYEQSWGLTYSAGRILDKFYSKHFKEILSDKRQLSLYLKKSALFDNLGIIGVCNNYLVKFTNLQESAVEPLESVSTEDTLITVQVSKAKSICKSMLKTPDNIMKVNDGNKDYDLKNVRKRIKSISKIRDNEKMEDSMTEILSQISYQQIGEAMTEIENVQFKIKEWKKYSFLERDFGFFTYDNFDSITTRKNFLSDYNKYTEIQFYENMLGKAGIIYRNKDGSLDYDTIYEMLKYNVVVAFVGGGGGKQDNEVYAIIKVLELTHKTTLGYPKKLCNSNGIYGCDSQDRASYWMQFLMDNKLLKQKHDEPVSFHY